jgi:hypothetical protein
MPVLFVRRKVKIEKIAESQRQELKLKYCNDFKFVTVKRW